MLELGSPTWMEKDLNAKLNAQAIRSIFKNR